MPRAFSRRLKQLLWRNTELRLRVQLLEAQLRAEREQAINWQQVALAAIAKSDALQDQQLWRDIN